MGGAAALISRPHHRDLLCTKQTIKSRGEEGSNWNRNWQRHKKLGVLKTSQIIVDDWTTFEIIIQDKQWTQQEKSYYNRCDIFTLDRIKHWQDPGSCRFIYTCLHNIVFSWLWRQGLKPLNIGQTNGLQALYKKNNKEILKPQTYALIVKKNKYMNHTYSSEIPRMYDKSPKSPNFKSDFDRLSPVKKWEPHTFLKTELSY